MIRHKTPVWYANYVKADPIKDLSLDDTGEKSISYGNPNLIQAHVSSAMGETDVRQFGEMLDYDRVVVLDDPKIELTEQTVMWIETAPELNANGSLKLDSNGNPVTPWDYVVRKIARSANYVSIAVKKVVVS